MCIRDSQTTLYMNTFTNTNYRSPAFAESDINELLHHFNSSMAPNQENLDICAGNKYWQYESYNHKEIMDGQDSLLGIFLQLFGLSNQSIFYYYQNDG